MSGSETVRDQLADPKRYDKVPFEALSLWMALGCRYKMQQKQVGEHCRGQLLKKDPVPTAAEGAVQRAARLQQTSGQAAP